METHQREPFCNHLPRLPIGFDRISWKRLPIDCTVIHVDLGLPIGFDRISWKQFARAVPFHFRGWAYRLASIGLVGN